MTTLEEALVLRELVKTGLTQTEIAALCARHKSVGEPADRPGGSAASGARRSR